MSRAFMVAAKRLALCTDYLEIHDENRISGGVDWSGGAERDCNVRFVASASFFLYID
jgi:hypothetical protein